MPLTKKEEDRIKDIYSEYRKKGYSKKRSKYIANAVVYSHKRKVESM